MRRHAQDSNGSQTAAVQPAGLAVLPSRSHLLMMSQGHYHYRGLSGEPAAQGGVNHSGGSSRNQRSFYAQVVACDCCAAGRYCVCGE